MMNVQRSFGKLLPRSADGSQVSVLLKEFDDADKMLGKIIDASKAWRDGWLSILSTQLQLAAEFESMYRPIIGSSDLDSAPHYAETPSTIMNRTAHLREEYEELKSSLLDEVNMVDVTMVQPAMEAKDHIQPLKKVIKKRDDKKVDFERYQGRVDTMRKKMKRSDRDNAALARSEEHLTRAKQEYKDADDHLISTLPPVISATFSLLPRLLFQQILIQNSLLAQCYTVIHNYCQEEGFPSPPPPMEQILSDWKDSFKPAQHDIETSISCIAMGKMVRKPLESDLPSNGSSYSGRPMLENGPTQRRGSSPLLSQKAIKPPPVERTPSSSASSSLVVTQSRRSVSPSVSRPGTRSTISDDQRTPGRDEYPTTTTPGATPSSALTRPDYFSQNRVTSSSSVMSAVAAKKKPPPPPPPKRGHSLGMWVTALYSFEGQTAGDLSFKQGDKIRVMRRTESTDDWWEGELRGAKGSFPANYCQVG
ncbi:MAG: hypothetical protein M1823_004106 [Watsoniomyces obsoletus]|nr:MAG: hypothetical protein M1823_004106 [Watsoniomyces obsoletus]